MSIQLAQSPIIYGAYVDAAPTQRIDKNRWCTLKGCHKLFKGY